jgi:flagellar P-ring protein precursor FlgI
MNQPTTASAKTLAAPPTRQAATLVALLAALLLAATPAMAARIKDLAAVKGVRDNQLVGYGIVVGLNGTGDGKNAAFTTNGLANLMRNMGVKIDPQEIKVKNVASVIVTAKLPPFTKVGQVIDVTLSSVGDASSLQGGTLLATPLKGLDNQVYAIAQGAISIGGFETQDPAQAIGRQKNHLTVARIPAGATVEQEVPVSFARKKNIAITLGTSDFTTADRMVGAINKALGGDYAAAKDGATVDVTVPEKFRNKEVAFLATLENLEVHPDRTAKVVLDERTGTVVMGENVRLTALALSHGNLSLQITPAPPTTPPSSEKKEKVMATGNNGQKLVNFAEGTSLGEVVRALNAVGVAPRDLIAIFQTMKASGALQADLEII